jgi:hypothetical protein
MGLLGCRQIRALGLHVLEESIAPHVFLCVVVTCGDARHVLGAAHVRSYSKLSMGGSAVTQLHTLQPCVNGVNLFHSKDNKPPTWWGTGSH